MPKSSAAPLSAPRAPGCTAQPSLHLVSPSQPHLLFSGPSLHSFHSMRFVHHPTACLKRHLAPPENAACQARLHFSVAHAHACLPPPHSLPPLSAYKAPGPAPHGLVFRPLRPVQPLGNITACSSAAKAPAIQPAGSSRGFLFLASLLPASTGTLRIGPVCRHTPHVPLISLECLAARLPMPTCVHFHLQFAVPPPLPPSRHFRLFKLPPCNCLDMRADVWGC